MDGDLGLNPEVLEKLAIEFPGLLMELTSLKKEVPELEDIDLKRLHNEILGHVHDHLLLNPSLYYDLKAFFGSGVLIEPPPAYTCSKGYARFEQLHLGQCQEELAAGLPTGVFDFDGMKSYPHFGDGAYMQSPVGLYRICSVGLPLPHQFPEFDVPMDHKYRLVIDDEDGIDLYIAPDEQEAILPTCAGLYLVAPGIVQLTLKTVVYDNPSWVDEMINRGEEVHPAVVAAMERGSYFFHASLLKVSDVDGAAKWEVVPGMTENALLMNRDFIHSGDRFKFPIKMNVPFVRELFSGLGPSSSHEF